MTFSPDSKLLYSGGIDTTVKIWNVISVKILLDFRFAQAEVGRRSDNELYIAIIYYPAYELLFSFLLLTSSSVFQLASIAGQTVIKYQPAASLNVGSNL